MIISSRHKRLGLKTKVTQKITDIPAGDWNKIFPHSLEGYNFFKTLDESNLVQFSFYYIMVYEGKMPVGATTCFLMDYSMDTSITGSLKSITRSIKKVLPNIFSLKALVCGVPIGEGRMGLSGRTDRVLNAILRRIEQIAKKSKTAVIAFKDFGRSYRAVLDPLQRYGYHRLDGLPVAELEVSFKNFEEYLKTLSGATRYDLRRKFKKVDSRIAIDLEVRETLEEETLRDVYKLYLNMAVGQDTAFEILTIDFFRNISRNMPAETRFFIWRIGGKIVAFLLCLVSKDVLMDYYVGLDYSVAYKYHLYFIKFRDVLNWCIEHNVRKYEMGNTTYEPKRRLGFSFIPFYIYVKLRNRALRPAFRLICQFLKFENFDPDLKKVKTEETRR